MSKLLKRLFYIVCVSALIYGFTGCKSTPKPKQTPDPTHVQPAEPEKNEKQEAALKLLNELEKVRAEAVELKADSTYPEQFKAADDTAAEAKSTYAANDYAAAQEKTQRAITQYRTLINQMHITALKATIDEHDLSSYDAENYRKGEELFKQILTQYNSHPSAAFEASIQALNCYEMVKTAGMAVLMEDAKKKADAARVRCDSVKSAAAMKDAYDKTVNRYRYANIAAENKKYEKAYKGYMAAAADFDDIYEQVKIKRAKALEAMQKAKARQEASSKLAQDADREAPLPENTEGFSSDPIDIETLKQPSHNSADNTAQQPAENEMPTEDISENKGGNDE